MACFRYLGHVKYEYPAGIILGQVVENVCVCRVFNLNARHVVLCSIIFDDDIV